MRSHIKNDNRMIYRMIALSYIECVLGCMSAALGERVKSKAPVEWAKSVFLQRVLLILPAHLLKFHTR